MLRAKDLPSQSCGGTQGETVTADPINFNLLMCGGGFDESLLNDTYNQTEKEA